jgi:hypothetical protein
MNKITTLLACTLIMTLSLHAVFAEEVYPLPAETLNQHQYSFNEESTAPVLVLVQGELQYRNESKLVSTNRAGELPITQYLGGDVDYDETPFRRFEIIFLISIPVTLALSFAGLAAYKIGAGTWGNFETIDYSYLILSSISLSFSVAIHDNRVVFKKRGT